MQLKAQKHIPGRDDNESFEDECKSYSQASQIMSGHAMSGAPSWYTARDYLKLYSAVGVLSGVNNIAR